MQKNIQRLNDSNKSLDDYVEEIILKISERMLKLKTNKIQIEFMFLDIDIDLPPDIDLCFRAIMNQTIQN